MYNYILTPTKLTIVGNQRHIQIENDNPLWDQCKELIKLKDFDKIIELCDKKTEILTYMGGKISIIDDCIYINNKPIHNKIVDRIIQFKNEGYDYEPLIRFMENELLNPNKESVKDLYDFIEHGNMPITSDGCFLAYKVVDHDYYDIHSHTFCNKVGYVCFMNREDVDNDRNNTCSTGLHVCTFDYIKSFMQHNSHIMIVKVNPKDVVSVPIDYNHAKMRCCRYKVIDEHIRKDEEYFDELLFNDEDYDDIYFDIGDTFTLNKFINNNLRKGMEIEILDISDDMVDIKRVNGSKIYTVPSEKLLNCLE